MTFSTHRSRQRISLCNANPNRNLEQLSDGTAAKNSTANDPLRPRCFLCDVSDCSSSCSPDHLCWCPPIIPKKDETEAPPKNREGEETPSKGNAPVQKRRRKQHPNPNKEEKAAPPKGTGGSSTARHEKGNAAPPEGRRESSTTQGGYVTLLPHLGLVLRLRFSLLWAGVPLLFSGVLPFSF